MVIILAECIALYSLISDFGSVITHAFVTINELVLHVLGIIVLIGDAYCNSNRFILLRVYSWLEICSLTTR